MNNGDDPAFACAAKGDKDNWQIIQKGLTKREYFAGLAMQGALACRDTDPTIVVVAEYSVQYADALLAELVKPQEVKE